MSQTIIKDCLFCNKKFNAPLKEVKRGNGKFCSLSCSSKYSRSLKGKPKNNVTCAYCKKPFYKQRSHFIGSKSGLFFCCRQHKNLAQKLNGIKEIHPSTYNKGIGNYRKIAFEAFPPKCNRCGYKDCIEILKVHHKDRNRQNRNLSNLEILCPNCHELDHFIKKDGPYSLYKKV